MSLFFLYKLLSLYYSFSTVHCVFHENGRYFYSRSDASSDDINVFGGNQIDGEIKSLIKDL